MPTRAILLGYDAAKLVQVPGGEDVELLARVAYINGGNVYNHQLPVLVAASISPADMKTAVQAAIEDAASVYNWTVNATDVHYDPTPPRSMDALVVGGNTAGATISVSSGTFRLAGGNNITLSQNANSVTISGANIPAQTVESQSFGVSNLGNTSGTSGIASGAQGRFLLAGGNNITLSQSINGASATVTISAGAGGAETQVAVSGISQSQTMYTSGTVILSEQANITINSSVNGASQYLRFSVANPGGGAVQTYTFFNPIGEAEYSPGGPGQGSIYVGPATFPQVEFDRLVIPVVFTGATNSTGSYTLSMIFGLYTRNVSTLSLLHSTSVTQGLTHSGTASSTVNNGVRLLTVPWTSSVTPGVYHYAIGSRTTSGGANNASISMLSISNVNTALSGLLGVGSNQSVQYQLGQGHYSATTAAMPASIGLSNQIIGSIVAARRPPAFYFVSGTV